jgi:hypothetical protein
MTLFLHRFFGALVLDADAFEDIEVDRHASTQSALVVAFACIAAGFSSMALGVAGPAGFISGAIMALGVWLVWVMVVGVIGTTELAEPQTHSSFGELLRTLGFAAAPGVFIVFAAIRPAAPFVITMVSLWMIAAAVLGMRQALDYRHTSRAFAVCVLAWLVSIGVVATVMVIFSRTVE